jgi:hypothetical protein
VARLGRAECRATAGQVAVSAKRALEDPSAPAGLRRVADRMQEEELEPVGLRRVAERMQEEEPEPVGRRVAERVQEEPGRAAKRPEVPGA